MQIVVAGGHGQIALRVERQLAEAGHVALGIVRNPQHVDDVRATGAEALVLDLEDARVEDVAGHLDGVDAVLFAAGAGPGSGVARKDTVDRGASALLADAAEQAGVGRFVQISSMGAGAPPRPGTDETFAAYLQAKTAAEDDLRRRNLGWTVLRPGGLTNAPGTGRVRLAPSVPRGQISRDDVATVLTALLTGSRGIRQTLELVSGDTPIDDAVAHL
ncbi:MAG TPA: SDR family oxidoreductase [Acidimicrobiales bacterium]|nr:SDR family oxidoreductase [Acidimicrobiales bacterium]